VKAQISERIKGCRKGEGKKEVGKLRKEEFLSILQMVLDPEFREDLHDWGRRMARRRKKKRKGRES